MTVQSNNDGRVTVKRDNDGRKTVPTIRIQTSDFDVQAETTRLTISRHDVGAVVTFTGLCRDEGGRLNALELEHYPSMAEAELTRIADQASSRWPLTGLTIIHRVGKIAPGQNIVLVIAASSHRRAAFEAADFMMDYLKSNAPFWKKEHPASGASGAWVDAREQDQKDLKRW